MPGPITAKEEVMQMLGRLPDDVSVQDIEYRVTVMAWVYQGIEDIEAGHTVTQVERVMDE